MTAEEIAAGLSAAQKRAVKAFVASENRMGGYGKDSGCPGLIEAVGFNHPIFGSHYRLTPLGQQVRSILEGNPHDQ